MIDPVGGAASTLSEHLVVIDASVWISNLLPDDRNNPLAVTWVTNHLSNGGRFVSPVILALETSGAVARVSQDKILAHRLVQYLYSFPSLQLVPMDQPLIDEAIDIAIAFNLRGPDALYVAVARQLSIPLVTFDQEQLSRPAGIITTILP